MRTHHVRRLVLAATAILLALSGTALAAFQDLPPGGRVDDDKAAGIDPGGNVPQTRSNNADVVGGALAADRSRVPWAVFAHETLGPFSQIFVRSFKAGAWTTQGHGTVGGLANPKLAAASLNFNAFDIAEAPSLDFAGAGRAEPWATWSERGTFLNDPDHGPEQAQIFASRFHPPTDAAHPDTWEFSGPDRAATGPPLPSLNIHTDRAASEPAIAGGSVIDATAPGPWITWVESGAHAPGAAVNQLFVVKPSGPGQTTCDPRAFKLGDDATPTAALGGFCFGQVGVERLGGDPSLNVDRTRAAADPDIVFSGSNDSVPWVVWREIGPSHADGGGGGPLHDNSMVFAARAVAPGTPAPAGAVDGGLNWVVVGGEAHGVLDNSPSGGSCADDVIHEEECTLNLNLLGDAGPPRIASGTMTAGDPAVPWVVWQEGPEQSILVARLVDTGADAHFEFANAGRAVGHGLLPDITFSGHTPFVSWINGTNVVTGHFSNVGMFVKDNISQGATLTGDYRSSLASTCTADPFTADGSACQAGSLGTPFTLLFDEGVDTFGLRAKAYEPGAPSGETAAAVTQDRAAVSATVDPQGATVSAEFEYGPTTAYGSATHQQIIGGDGGPRPISEALTGLPSGTTIHYRALLRSDLGTVAGTDHTFTTAPVEQPPVTPPTEPPVSQLTGGQPPHDNGPEIMPRPRTAPVVTLHARLIGVPGRRIVITVGVDRPSTVVTRATITGRVRGRTRKLSLRRSTTHVAASQQWTVQLTLSPAAKRALRTWRDPRIVATTTATPLVGTPVTRRQTIRISDLV